jgi:hypothetical protein
VTDFNTVVEGLMRLTQCDRARAERVAIANGHTPPAPDPAALAQAARDAAILEKEEQREVWQRFVVCGFKGYWLSQARETKQTPGLADLWFMHPDRELALWWETKRQKGGKHSDAQKEFARLCHVCRITYGTGDRYDAERWLVEHGLAVVIGGVLEPIRHNSSLPAR